MSEDLKFAKRYLPAVNLVPSTDPVIMTVNMQDVGPRFLAINLKAILFWLFYTQNTSTGLQFQILAYLNQTSSNGVRMQIYNTNPALISMEKAVYQYTTDEDKADDFIVYPEKLRPFLQLQAKVAVVNTAGTIDEVNYTART